MTRKFSARRVNLLPISVVYGSVALREMQNKEETNNYSFEWKPLGDLVAIVTNKCNRYIRPNTHWWIYTYYFYAGWFLPRSLDVLCWWSTRSLTVMVYPGYYKHIRYECNYYHRKHMSRRESENMDSLLKYDLYTVEKIAVSIITCTHTNLVWDKRKGAKPAF